MEIGKLLRGMFTLAKAESADQWDAERRHPVFLKLAAAWVEAFHDCTATMARQPDGWGELRDIEWMFHNAAVPVSTDPELSPEWNTAASKAMNHHIALSIGDAWIPLWVKCLPFLEDAPMVQALDGPVGSRGWRHNGKETHDLEGGEPMEVMLALHDKPNGHKYRPSDGNPKKLRERVNRNCVAANLPWIVSCERSTFLVKMSRAPKKGRGMGPTN